MNEPSVNAESSATSIDPSAKSSVGVASKRSFNSRADLARLSVVDQQFVHAVDRKVADCRRLTDRQLTAAAGDLRESLLNERSPESTQQGFALSVEAIRRVLGFELFSVQLFAAKVLASGSIAEMATGEGKTVSAVPAIAMCGWMGAGVHVATPNAYLAERDQEQLAPIFELLGLRCELLREKVENPEKKQAYAADVTYGTGYEFGFDYLRDQMALRDSAMTQLGANIISQLRGEAPAAPTVQRGLVYSVVDEIDSVLLDDASTPLVLAEVPPGDAADVDAVRVACQLAGQLEEGTHFDVQQAKITLSGAGRDAIYHRDLEIPTKHLRRSWDDYVRQAIHARVNLTRDEHYVLTEDDVQIVDGTTGRIFADRTWQDGLHQAVQAKEGLQVSPESRVLAEITRQRFYRLYGHLCGMTGTANHCEQELQRVYRTPVVTVPLRSPSKRKIFPMQIYASRDAKNDAILRSVSEIHSTGRPILIGTRTIEESRALAAGIEALAIPFELLNGTQDAQEAAIVGRAGHVGSVTIATNLAGRGTDIKLCQRSRELDGLHVIVAECHASVRVDRQLVGRSARQGDPGSAQSFVSADDWLLVTHGAWLADTIKKLKPTRGALLNLEKKIRGVQLVAERQLAAARDAIMRADLAREDR